eukprot:TRINITY_DN3490_c1_g1_i1.p1 TRINITY_DN3490_c1_g1~~TRINITY_DN3490_c1_g1_i1.p1  ORF type:complete len:216 (+),score=30.01 TRINITY_DN3490_c1_g1_i1:125-772(+)
MFRRTVLNEGPKAARSLKAKLKTLQGLDEVVVPRSLLRKHIAETRPKADGFMKEARTKKNLHRIHELVPRQAHRAKTVELRHVLKTTLKPMRDTSSAEALRKHLESCGLEDNDIESTLDLTLFEVINSPSIEDLLNNRPPVTPDAAAVLEAIIDNKDIVLFRDATVAFERYKQFLILKTQLPQDLVEQCAPEYWALLTPIEKSVWDHVGEHEALK